MLEADQKRFASKHQEALREAQESKLKYEEGILQNKEEKLKLEAREKEIDRQKEALERQRLEVQDSWNHYQKECEALRKAREAQSAHPESSRSRAQNSAVLIFMSTVESVLWDVCLTEQFCQKSV